MGCLWSVDLEFKIFKMLLSLSIFKKKQIRGGHFHITTQSLSVWSDDSIIYSTTSPLHHFPSVSNYDSNPAVSVRFIDSTTLPLHIFCQVHFPSVNNCDSNPVVSVRFNDSTTLPLHSFCQVHFPSVRADDSVILRINT
jgi:hypothetical protein